MNQGFLPLLVLFIVIFDPLASLAVFFVGTTGMSEKQRHRIATLAIIVAASISYLFLIFGQALLTLFNTTINEFKIAGGIILLILGIRMALGQPLANLSEKEGNRGRAIAAIIGTPLLTGPAAITTIIVSVNDYGFVIPTLAVTIVLILCGLCLYFASWLKKHVSTTAIQVLSTILGLITLAWGVNFILTGLKAVWG